MVFQRSMLDWRRGGGLICHGYMCIVLYMKLIWCHGFPEIYAQLEEGVGSICHGYMCIVPYVTNTIMYLPQVHWGYYQTPIWSLLAMAMGQEICISMPYEYMWALSMEQRGTTELTIYTAFIHIKTSLTAYITSQCMVG